MSFSANASQWLEAAFAPIDLAALNAKAAMLERIDNKYIVGAAVVRRAVPDLTRHFDILQIDGTRAFTYETCYFDDRGLHSYFDHHQGRRKRAKVRTRKYLDTGLCFLEIKLKDKRGRTIKKRMAYDSAKHGTLDDQARTYVRDTYRAFYHEEFQHEIARVIDMRYVRVTLVAKQGDERMTIDRSLRFIARGTALAVDEDVFILETKSANGNGIADRFLRRLHQHPTKHCSKYCAGTAYMEASAKHNNFRPVLRKLGFLPLLIGRPEARTAGDAR
jgi:hypothetical protein